MRIKTPAVFTAGTPRSARAAGKHFALGTGALLISLLLAACGGGGGNDSSPSAGGGNTMQIMSVSPSSALADGTVTITGTGFDVQAGATTVKIGGVPATVVSQTATELKVKVPAAASTGTLSVTTKAATASTTEPFVVIAGIPTISGHTPRVSLGGELVSIAGTNFGATPSENAVTVNGVPFEVTSASKTSLTVKVPATVGSGPLQVRVGDVTATAPATFLVNPRVTAMTPTSAAPGDTLTLSGSNLTRAMEVDFSGAPFGGRIVTAIGTEMTVVIPGNAVTGTVNVNNIDTQGGGTTAGTLTLTSPYAPTITSYTPANALPGARVTIYGSNFDGSPTLNAVFFGGVRATVTAVNSTADTLFVTVPSLGQGYYKLQVTTSTGTVTAKNMFEVAATPTPPPPGVSLSATTLDFGNVDVNSAGSQTVTVTNTGSTSLKMANASVSGSVFRRTGNSCYGYNYQLEYFDALAPGKSCTFDVDFLPTTPSSSAATLTFDAGVTPYTVNLQGTGVIPPAPAPVFSLSTLAFDARELGTVSAPKTVRLTNNGNAALTMDSTTGLQVLGEFNMTHSCPTALQPGSFCDVSVSFAPVSRVGDKTGTLLLTSVNAPTLKVDLTGQGTLAHSGRLAVYTRESWGVDNVYVDGIWAGRLNYDSQDVCGGLGAVTLTLAPGDHTVMGDDAVMSFTPQKATVTEGGCTVVRMVGTSTCKAPNFVSGGFCYPPSPPVTCTAPQVLRNGVCVDTGITAAPGDSSTVATNGAASTGGNGGVATDFDATNSTGQNAAQCLRFGIVTGAAAYYNDSQTITNVCNYEVYVLHCHSPSTKGGTSSSACGAGGRFFQQFYWLQAGQVYANYYTMPLDTTIWYGACSGGRYTRPTGKQVNLAGQYICQ